MQTIAKLPKQRYFPKIVQNAHLEPCGARFDQIALLIGPDLKTVLMAANHRQIGETVLSP